MIKKNAIKINNEFKINRELESKSLGYLPINNAEKIEGVNRTYQKTGQLTAKSIHSKVTDMRKVGVDRQVLQQLSKQKLTFDGIIETVSKQTLHGNKGG